MARAVGRFSPFLLTAVAAAAGCIDVVGDFPVADLSDSGTGDGGRPGDGTAGCAAGSHACGARCADNRSLDTCGTQCTPCPVPTNGKATCDGTACGVSCDPAFMPNGPQCAPIPAPKQLWPMSTATSTTRQPTFKWKLPSGEDGAHIDVCRDRACTTVVLSQDVAGEQLAVTQDLPSGVVFWKLRGRVKGNAGNDPSPIWELFVPTRSAPVATAWGSVLDVNADGYADLAVGALNEPVDADGGAGPGRVYMFAGGNAGLDPNKPTIIEAPAPQYFGQVIGSAGDVNGDGYADLFTQCAYQGSEGRVFIYAGGPAGVATTPTTTLLNPDGNNTYFGISFGAMGDVNHDGFADVAIQSIGYINVYFGSSTGLGATPGQKLTRSGISGVAAAGDLNGDGLEDLAAIDKGATSVVDVFLSVPGGLPSQVTQTIQQPEAGGLFPEWIACTGDNNGDGYADVGVSTYNIPTPTGHGRVYLYKGGASGVATTPYQHVDEPVQGSDYYGRRFASGGNVDGSGYSWLAISDFGFDDGRGMGTGATWLFAGRADGVHPQIYSGLKAPLAGTGFGLFLAAADTNGDGLDELALGDNVGDVAYVADSARNFQYVPFAGQKGGGFGKSVALR